MKEIEIVDSESNVFGYLTSIEEDNAFNYLNAFFSDETIQDIRAWLKEEKIFEFAILRNIYVDEEDRGKGVGKSLVSNFIIKSHHLPVILLASPDEESFNLQAWYEKLGFELTPFICEDGPLMIRL